MRSTQWGNYEGNRLDIARLDLAILEDLGITIKSTEGLPLVDTIDSQAPRNTLSQLTMKENIPVGSIIGTLSTTAGTAGYTFALADGGPDNSAFEIVGNLIKTKVAIDFETKASYSILVRNSDAQGVWTATPFTIEVIDVNDYQIPLHKLDINGDTIVSALDTLLIINELNRNGPGPIASHGGSAPHYFDVNADYFVTAVDVLLVINYLNLTSPTAYGEGESFFGSLGSDETQRVEKSTTTPESVDKLSGSYWYCDSPEREAIIDDLATHLVYRNALSAAWLSPRLRRR